MRTVEEMLKRIGILNYEVGGVQKDLIYWANADDDKKKAYQLHLKTTLADTWVQLRELVIDCGYDPYQLEEFALERYEESKKEVVQRLGSSKGFLKSNWGIMSREGDNGRSSST